MNLQEFLQRRARREQEKVTPKRELCAHCWQPTFSCFCSELRPFDPGLSFVLLTHPGEAKKRLATGRMAYCALDGSFFFRGFDFDSSKEFRALLNNRDYEPFVLYPGSNASNLSEMSAPQKAERFGGSRRPLVIVIDGTWGNAKKMYRLSTCLHSLPRIAYIPTTESRFRVRRQPKAECHSSIEAIHSVIDMVGDARGFATSSRIHDRLISLFDYHIDKQVGKLDSMRESGGLLGRDSKKRARRREQRDSER